MRRGHAIISVVILEPVREEPSPRLLVERVAGVPAGNIGGTVGGERAFYITAMPQAATPAVRAASLAAHSYGILAVTNGPLDYRSFRMEIDPNARHSFIKELEEALVPAGYQYEFDPIVPPGGPFQSIYTVKLGLV